MGRGHARASGCRPGEPAVRIASRSNIGSMDDMHLSRALAWVKMPVPRIRVPAITATEKVIEGAG